MPKDNSTEINKWLDLCRLSQKEREVKQPMWDLISRYFRGTAWTKSVSDDYQIITVNLVYSHVKVVIPSVFNRYPHIYFIPTTPEAVDATKLLEAVLNADIRKMKLKETNKRILQDCILYGTGFSKTTFEIEPGYSPEPEDTQIINELQDKFHDIDVAEVIKNRLTVPKAGPVCIRVHPKDLLFDLELNDFMDPGFIAHKARKRLLTIKNDPYYKNTKDLQPTFKLRSDLDSSIGEMITGNVEEYLQMVDVYEVWDVENQKWFTIADGHDKYLTEPEDNPYPYDHPFDRLIFTPIDGETWGMGEIEPWVPQADELNIIRSQQVNHIKRYNRKYAVIEDSFSTEEDKERLMAGEDGTVVTFKASGKSLRELFSPIEDAPMPADVYRMSATVEDDIVKIGRISPYRRGAVAEPGGTATAANIAEGNANLGDIDRIDAINEFMLNQLEKVRKARRRLTIGTEILDVTGNPLDTNRWQYWTKEDIDVESQMCIEFGSTRPINEDTKKQDALLIYDRAMANPTTNPMSAFTKLLEVYGTQDIPSWFLPAELIQMQLILKALGAAREQKGISPMGPNGISSGEPGPANATETPAELKGRAAPVKKVANG